MRPHEKCSVISLGKASGNSKDIQEKVTHFSEEGSVLVTDQVLAHSSKLNVSPAVARLSWVALGKSEHPSVPQSLCSEKEDGPFSGKHCGCWLCMMLWLTCSFLAAWTRRGIIKWGIITTWSEVPSLSFFMIKKSNHQSKQRNYARVSGENSETSSVFQVSVNSQVFLLVFGR